MVADVPRVAQAVILNLREQLIRDEENRQFVYTDSVGVPTIGVGRNLLAKGLSELEREFMLHNDIAEHTLEVWQSLPVVATLDEIRREALINMSFNLGTGGLLKFVKFLAALQAKQYTTAAKEMLDSKWAEQVGPRAVRLSQQILTGVRQ